MGGGGELEELAVDQHGFDPRHVAAPGQSERPESGHQKDQMGLFESWGYKPFVWKREEMK